MYRVVPKTNGVNFVVREILTIDYKFGMWTKLANRAKNKPSQMHYLYKCYN